MYQKMTPVHGHGVLTPRRRRRVVPLTIGDCIKRQQGRDPNLSFRHCKRRNVWEV